MPNSAAFKGCGFEIYKLNTFVSVNNLKISHCNSVAVGSNCVTVGRKCKFGVRGTFKILFSQC